MVWGCSFCFCVDCCLIRYCFVVYCLACLVFRLIVGFWFGWILVLRWFAVGLSVLLWCFDFALLIVFWFGLIVL